MKELKVRQVCLFIITFLPIMKLFMMFSVIAKHASNDMWISLVINSLIDLIVVMSAIFVYQKTNKSFVEILNEKLGKKCSKIILSFFLIYFIAKALIPINEQKDYVILTLYIAMPKLLYFIPFFFMSYYICSQKLRALGRLADLLWIIMIIGVVLLIVLSIKNADFYALLPINYNNTKGIIKGSYYSQNWFGDGLYLLLIIGEFQKEKKWGLKIILSYAFSFLIVIIFGILFYSIFTSIAFRQRFALTELSKYSTVISNTGRFDYIGIVLILFIDIFSVSLPIFFACRVFRIIFNVQKNWLASLIINATLLIFMLAINHFFYGVEQFILKYFGFFYLTVANLFPIVLAILTRFSKKGVQREILKN